LKLNGHVGIRRFKNELDNLTRNRRLQVKLHFARAGWFRVHVAIGAIEIASFCQNHDVQLRAVVNERLPSLQFVKNAHGVVARNYVSGALKSAIEAVVHKDFADLRVLKGGQYLGFSGS
jgi:hypothetical protein